MTEVSLSRLYVLRATYLLLVVAVGIQMIWPLLLDSPETAEHFRGVTWSLLSTVALLSLLGLRYPLKMLPLLFFELIWKATWVIAIGLPLLLEESHASAVPAVFAEDRTDGLLALDDALQRLERLAPRQSRVVICRFFGD